MKRKGKDEVAVGCLGAFVGACAGAVVGGVVGGFLGYGAAPDLGSAPTLAVLVYNPLSATALGVVEGTFLGGLLGAIGGGALAYERVMNARIADNGQFLAAIQQAGGSARVNEDQPGQPVTEIDLAGAKDADTVLACLKGAEQLRRIDLRGAVVTDAGLAHLGSLTQITYLDLGNTGITDLGLARLQALRNLDVVFLGGADGVTESAIEALQQALPRVKVVR